MKLKLAPFASIKLAKGVRANIGKKGINSITTTVRNIKIRTYTDGRVRKFLKIGIFELEI